MTASAAVVAPTSEPVLAEAPSPNSSSYSSSYTTGSAHHSYIPRNTLQAIAAINERGEIQQLKETISTMHEERTATLQLVGSLEKELRETMFALSTVQEKLAQQRTENASLQVTLTNTRKKNALLSGVPEAKVLHSVEDIPLLEEVERQLAHNRLKEDAVELQSVMQGLEGKLKAEMEAARGAQRSSRELKGKVKDMKRKLMSCNETRIRSETRYSHLLEEHNSLKKTYAEGLNGRAKLKFKLKKLQLENESLQQRYSNEVKQNESFYSKERGQLAVLSGKVKVLEEEKKETQEENRACVDSLMRELEASRVREIQMTETIAELKLEYDVISSRVTLGMGDGEDTDRHSTQSDGDSDTAKPRESPLEAESREKEARARTRAEEENKEMAGRIAEMEERNASLAKRASDAQKQLDLVSSDLVDAQQSINELTKTAELERKEREEERKEERKTREAEAKRMADKMSAVEGERTQAKELNSDLNKDIDTLLAEVKKLKASEEKSEQEQARLRTTLANCELEIGQLHERIDYSEVENESLLAQMEEQEKERTERASQRSETDHLLSENAQKLQELTDKLEESESEKQTLMVVRKTLQVRLHEMHIELKKAEAVTARDLFDQMLKDVVRFWSANVQKLASRVRRLTAKSLAREKKAIIDAIKELKQQSYREVLAMTAKLGGVQRHLSSEIERNQDAYIQSQTQAQQARYADEYADNSDGRGLEGSFRRSTSSDEEGGQGGHSRKDSENDHERMNGGDGRGGSGHGGEVDAEKNDSEVTHDKCRQRINELEHLLEVARRNHQDLSSEYQEYARLNSEHIAELEQENEGLFNELSSQIQINQLANEHNLHYTKIVDDIGDVVLDSSEPVKIDV